MAMGFRHLATDANRLTGQPMKRNRPAQLGRGSINRRPIHKLLYGVGATPSVGSRYAPMRGRHLSPLEMRPSCQFA